MGAGALIYMMHGVGWCPRRRRGSASSYSLERPVHPRPLTSREVALRGWWGQGPDADVAAGGPRPEVAAGGADAEGGDVPQTVRLPLPAHLGGRQGLAGAGAGQVVAWQYG